MSPEQFEKMQRLHAQNNEVTQEIDTGSAASTSETRRTRPTRSVEEMPDNLRQNAHEQQVETGQPTQTQIQGEPSQQQQAQPTSQGFSNMSMSGSTERRVPKRDATQTARERMQANRVNQQQHTVHTAQTEGYVEQSTTEAQTVNQQNQPNQTAAQNQSARQNTTTIIGGGSDDNNNATEKKRGFQLNKKSGWVIIAIIAALIVGAYIIFNNKSGEEKAENTDPITDAQGDLEWINPNDIVLEPTYGPEDVQQLRAAGYTGDEIEQYSASGVDKEDLLRQAKAQRDAFMKEGDKDLYDVSSDAYKHYINQTWLTLPKREDIQDWKMLGFNYSERKNLDYEKIDVYGNQLFLKIYLDDKDHASWFYLNVTPTEWNALNDSGNVIVNYTYATHLVGDDVINSVEDKQNIYIIEASIEILEKEVQ